MPDSPNNPPPGAQVRLRYASFITFALNLTSSVFAVFFLTLLTRRLSIEDYATWVMLWRYIGYFLIPSVIYSVWVTRDVSRGMNTSLTGVMASIVFGLASIPFYLLVVFFLSGNLEQPIVPLMISSGILFLDSLNNGLYSVSLGHAPQISGYANFVVRSAQLLFGLLFVVFWSFGLTEAVVVALASRVLMNAVSIYLNRSLLTKSSFDPCQIAKWIKSSWLPLFGSIAGLLVSFDVLVVGLTLGSQIPVAYYGVCISIASFATFASAVTSSLYPKILFKKNLDDLKEAIWLISLLSLPIIFIMMIYAGPLCAILNIAYTPVASSLRIMLLGVYFQLMSGMASSVYYGLDPFDEKTLESKALMKSSIFKGYRISFTIGIAYLLLLYLLSLTHTDHTTYVMFWVAAWALLYLASFLAFTLRIKRNFGMPFPFSAMLKDVLVFVVPALFSVIPSILIPVVISESFYQALYGLIPPASLSLAVYFIVLFIIEKRFRSTVKDVLAKLRSGISRDAA